MSEMPDVLYRPQGRHEHRITVTGAWFPKRDDVQGVIRLRAHLRDSLPPHIYSLRDDVFLDVILRDSNIDMDRALTGVMTAMDGQHGGVEAALWDDSVIRQARVTRITTTQGETLG